MRLGSFVGLSAAMVLVVEACGAGGLSSDGVVACLRGKGLTVAGPTESGVLIDGRPGIVVNSGGSADVGTAMVVLYDSSADAQSAAKYPFLPGETADPRGRALVYFATDVTSEVRAAVDSCVPKS